MDDKATWECAILELAWRLRNRVPGHTMEDYRSNIRREAVSAYQRWVAKLGTGLSPEDREGLRHRMVDLAPKVIERWIQRYAALDYTEIAQFTRAQLLREVGLAA